MADPASRRWQTCDLCQLLRGGLYAQPAPGSRVSRPRSGHACASLREDSGPLRAGSLALTWETEHGHRAGPWCPGWQAQTAARGKGTSQSAKVCGNSEDVSAAAMAAILMRLKPGRETQSPPRAPLA